MCTYVSEKKEAVLMNVAIDKDKNNHTTAEIGIKNT